MITIKEVFDELFAHVKFDARLAKKVKRYQIEFVNRNPEHMGFFGGNLMGVHRVRFTLKDYAEFFDEMMDREAMYVERQIGTIDTINHEFKISSDALNQTLVYMIHRFLTSPYLNPHKRVEAAVDVGLIFGYRTIAALLVHYFKYPIDTYTAQAVYERLSGRYLIKKLGTWQEVFKYRAEEFVDPQGVHYQKLIPYTDDAGIVNAINDLQSRTKDMLKNIYVEFIKVHESGSKIHSSSSTMVDADGEEIVKDRIHGLDNYKTYVLETLADRNSFIKQELMAVVESVIPTASGKSFRLVLQWMADNITGKERELVLQFVDMSLVLSYNYLLKNEYVLHRSKNLIVLTSNLKGYVLSSRENSADLEQLRKLGSSIVSKATGHVSEQTLAAIRNAVFIYICLRAYTKHAYHQ